MPSAVLGGVVLIPADPAPEEALAARELAHYWELVSGEALEVVRESGAGVRQLGPRGPSRGLWRRLGRMGSSRDLSPLAGRSPFFVVGETSANVALASLPEGLDESGFVLRSSPQGLHVRGKNPSGTLFGVYRFLHEYAGVRWYMPTELGEHVPRLQDRALPEIDLIEEPSFASRQWSAAAVFDGRTWERRNLIQGRHNFHHNLHRIFTEEVFEEHPEFFLLQGGVRVRPDSSLGSHNHQICFGNPETAAFAARQAAAFFDENPKATSFSLGMNDTNPVCEDAYCQDLIDGEQVFRDKPDYSDLLFTFMNRAAEKLAETHPDKYLGCLAYHWAENVPSFLVHPKVIPYLTADRSQWLDSGFQAEERDLIARWSSAGPEKIGIYDYYYGGSFIIPRLYTEISHESLQYAYAQGITGFYGELYSNWTLDGPKAWLASQLLWNIDQDREELLDDYYTHFFQEAAGPMREFFGRCEEIWMEQEGRPYWLRLFYNPVQLELFSAAVTAELREKLSEAEAAAESDLVLRRVRLFSEGFRLTEFYSELYYGLMPLPGRSPETREDGDALLMELERLEETKIDLDHYYETVIFPNDLHNPRRKFDDRLRFSPEMRLQGMMPALFEWAREYGEEDRVLEQIERLDRTFPRSRALLAWNVAEILEVHRFAGRDLALNGAFDNDGLFYDNRAEFLNRPEHTPFGWDRWSRPGTPARIVLSDATAFDGPVSLRAAGVVEEIVYQPFPVDPSNAYRFSARVNANVSLGNLVQIKLYWWDGEGRNLPGDSYGIDQLRVGETEGWELLETVASPPAGAEEALAYLSVFSQAEDDYAWFDDIAIVEIDWNRTNGIPLDEEF
ncbi:MAG: DUF4838 domain-containing protein [Opitutales bacterium]